MNDKEIELIVYQFNKNTVRARVIYPKGTNLFTEKINIRNKNSFIIFWIVNHKNKR